MFTAENAESADEMTERENLTGFNVKVLKDGLRRVVNDFPDSLRSPPVGVLRRLCGKQIQEEVHP